MYINVLSLFNHPKLLRFAGGGEKLLRFGQLRVTVFGARNEKFRNCDRSDSINRPQRVPVNSATQRQLHRQQRRQTARPSAQISFHTVRRSPVNVRVDHLQRHRINLQRGEASTAAAPPIESPITPSFSPGQLPFINWTAACASRLSR